MESAKGEDEEVALPMKHGAGTLPEIGSAPRPSQSLGNGGKLPGGVRSFFERRIGHDLARVRVHTGARAAESAGALNARAYTVGRHVVFGKGEYSPHSREGRWLLAHELTHVLQQTGGGRHAVREPTYGNGRAVQPGCVQDTTPRIQRAAEDYRIHGLPPDAAQFPNRIFFLPGQSTIPGSEQPKIAAWVAANPGAIVTVTGLTSEEGSAAGNTSIANARAQAVRTALISAGHPAANLKATANVSAGQGKLDYRHWRAAQIGTLVVPTAAIVPCLTVPNYSAARLTNAITEAERLIQNGITLLGAAPRAGTTNTVLQQYFTDQTDATANNVHDKLNHSGTGLKEHVHDMSMATRHQCTDHCGNTGGWNNGCPNGRMTLCPRFWTDTLAARAELLIHEGAHGAGMICAKDHAYSHTRLFEHLTQPLQLENSDSYLLLLQELDGQVVSVGPSVPDVFSGFTVPGEQTTVEKIVAWLEKYLVGTYLQMSFLYRRLRDHHDNGTSWTAGDFYTNMMTTLQNRFPELTAPPTVVTTNRRDLSRVAAIHDRYRIMRDTFRRRTATGAGVPLNLTRAAAGVATSWQTGPGVDVTVGDDFFSLIATPMPQVLFLLEKLVIATANISDSFHQRYVDFLEDLRALRGQPTPP